MKVFELIGALSKCCAEAEVEFSMLLSDRDFLKIATSGNSERLVRYISNPVDNLIELGESVMLFSEE